MSQSTKKTACDTKGHWWQSTLSPLIFRCGRTGCKATQHCINGVWHETQPNAPKPTGATVAQQADLWA